MTVPFVVDWKCCVVFGFTVLGVVSLAKLSPDAVKDVSIIALNTLKEVFSSAKVD